MTENQRCRDKPVMMSSVRPSAKYSCSGSLAHVLEGQNRNRRLVRKRQRFGIGRKSWPSSVVAVRQEREPVVDARLARRRTVSTLADKAKSALAQRANQALIVAAVAERPPRRADSGAERRLRDDAPLPNRLDQLVLAHDPVAVLNKVNDQVEHLRLDMNNCARAPQLVPSDVDLEIGEAKVQKLSPVARRAFASAGDYIILKKSSENCQIIPAGPEPAPPR